MVESPAVGEWWWLNSSDATRRFVAGRVDAVTYDVYTVRLEDGVVISAEARDMLHRIRQPEALATTVEDLVQLDEVNHPAIVDTLRRRYMRDAIYTNVADILVALNPFKAIPELYDIEAMKSYLVASIDSESAPHVYRTTMTAYTQLRESRMGQAILISGESGAGKTETTKQCLRMLGAVCAGGRVEEEAILSTNPVLESLGNAKTVRNDNSSRFGKFMHLYFDDHLTKITGCEIVSYLLEKSRVTTPGHGERSYHIFYQLCASDSALKKAADYPYLGRSGCFELEGVDDVAEFRTFREAMRVVGFEEAECKNVLEAVCAVLCASKIDFLESDNEESSVRQQEVPASRGSRRRSSVLNLDASLACATSLGLAPADLEDCLTHRSMIVRNATLKTTLNAKEAVVCRDALAKHLYGATFVAVVKALNGFFNGSTSAGGKHKIGVLDIFGFEIFEKNSLEQLCINFCNEKLQQFFTKHTFKEEVLLYESEEVPFEPIIFADNTDIIDLIEHRRHGMLRLLDDEVTAPGGSDANYRAKLGKQGCRWASHPRLSFDRRDQRIFTLEHYAGSVTYDVEDFVVKNRDRMFEDVAEKLCGSSNPFIAKLFDDAGSSSSGQQPFAKSLTSSGRFISQLSSLVQILEASQPHFVRCIKPNRFKRARCFHGEESYAQLNFSGVFEAVSIRQQGYPFRKTHWDFYRTFYLAATGKKLEFTPLFFFDQSAEQQRRGCEALSETLLLQVFVGRTLVLWRAPTQRVLLALRQGVVNFRVGSLVNQMCRKFAARQLLLTLRDAREAYAEALAAPDPGVVVDRALLRIGKSTLRFESREVRKLKVFKERLLRESELEPRLRHFVSLGVPGVNREFEELITECRRLELDSEIFKEAELLYVKVMEREAACVGVRDALGGDDEKHFEVDEASLTKHLLKLERLVRTYGASAMATPEEPLARTTLRACKEERLKRTAIIQAIYALLLSPVDRDLVDVSTASCDDLLSAVSRFEEGELFKSAVSGCLVRLARSLSPPRLAMLRALESELDEDWHLARREASDGQDEAMLALRDAQKSSSAAELVGVDELILQNFTGQLSLCDERASLALMCTEALEDLFSEDQLTDALAACEEALGSSTKGAVLCGRLSRLVRYFCERLAEELKSRAEILRVIAQNHIPRNSSQENAFAAYCLDLEQALCALEATKTNTPPPPDYVICTGTFLDEKSTIVGVLGDELFGLGNSLHASFNEEEEEEEEEEEWAQSHERASDCARILDAEEITAGGLMSGELRSEIQRDMELVTLVIEERWDLLAQCEAAIKLFPAEEAVLRAAVDRCSTPAVNIGGSKEAGAILCLSQAHSRTVKALERLLDEQRLLAAVKEAVLTTGGDLESALEATRGLVQNPLDLEALEGAWRLFALRRSLVEAAEKQGWEAESDAYLDADRRVLAIEAAGDAFASKAEGAFSTRLGSMELASEELQSALEIAQKSSVRAAVCEELQEAVYDLCDDSAVHRLRRCVEMARGLMLPRRADAGCSGWTVEEAGAQLNSALEALSQIESVLGELSDAIARCSQPALEEALALASEMGYLQGKLVSEALETLREIVVLVVDFERARKTLDRRGLQKAFDRARAMGLHDNRQMDALRKQLYGIFEEEEQVLSLGSYTSSIAPGICGQQQQLPWNSPHREAHFLKAMLLDAMLRQDPDLACAASLRLRERLFRKTKPQFFDLERSPAIKSPAEFVNLRFTDPEPDLQQRKTIASMLRFQEGPLYSALTRQLGDDTQRAQRIFAKVRVLMGDRAGSPAPIDEFKKFPDEVYAQLLKQLRENPRPESAQAGRSLLRSLILSNLLPSPTLLVYVEATARRVEEKQDNLAEHLLKLEMSRLVAWRSEPVVRGWLDVLSSSSNAPRRKPIQRRFFVLQTATKTLRYYATATTQKELSTIPTRHARLRALPSNDSLAALSYPFQVASITLAAISAEERAAWIAAIQATTDDACS